MDLTLDRRTHGRWAVVEVKGELDLYTAPSFRESVLEAGDAEDPKVIVDFRGLGFIDSSGLGAIVACLKHIRERGGDLVLVAPEGSAPSSDGSHRTRSRADALSEHRRHLPGLMGSNRVSTSRLRVTGDPALALVVRIFVGSVTDQWEPPSP